MNLDIKELAGSATATAGLVIATSIVLSMLTTKFAATFERYRALTGEMRDDNASDPRRTSLRDQITLYQRRCLLIRYASLCLLAGDLVFLTTITATALSVLFPQVLAWKLVTALSTLFGLILCASGVIVDLVETWMTRTLILSELHDLPGLPSKDAPRS